MSLSLSGLEFCPLCLQRISVKEKSFLLVLHEKAPCAVTQTTGSENLIRMCSLAAGGWKGQYPTRSSRTGRVVTGCSTPSLPRQVSMSPCHSPCRSGFVPPFSQACEEVKSQLSGVGKRSRVSRWEEQAKCSLSITLQCASFKILLTVLESWWHFSKHWQK